MKNLLELETVINSTQNSGQSVNCQERAILTFNDGRGISGLINFDGMSNRSGLFSALKLGNRVPCMFILAFFCVLGS